MIRISGVPKRHIAKRTLTLSAALSVEILLSHFSFSIPKPVSKI